jgi:Zn finger protein HypA/HybF involved in hydrogenase expression
MMQNARGISKAEKAFFGQNYVQQCRSCQRWSGKLKKDGICPRCDLLRTTEPALDQKKKAAAT